MSVQKTTSGLLVIDGATKLTDPVKGYCRMGCGTGFTAHEMRAGGEYERHVAACFSRNEQALMEQRNRERGFFDAGDQEAEGWTRDHAGEIIEGRKSDIYGNRRRR